MENKPRLLRITTVPVSLKLLLNGQLSYFQHQGFEVLAVSAEGPEVAALQEEGIEHRVVPMTRKVTPYKDLICLIRLIRIVRNFRPDIVHTHTPKAGLLGMLASWWCRVPVRMHTVAGLPLMEASGLLKTILILTERITYWCATAVYPNSSGLKKYIERNIYRGDKLCIIGKGSSNGIDTQHYRPSSQLKEEAAAIRERFAIRNNDVVFSFAGRLVKDKGVGELIKAFKKIISDEGDDVRSFLLLIGSFEQELDPLGSEDYNYLHGNPRVMLAGFQHDVRPWLMASDVFVFPSYREGFPNVVMQACALEIPVIASDINGCNEIIAHGETGLLVKSKDGGALYEAMRLLFKDPDKRNSFAKQAREFVKENFEQKYVWGELLKAYRKLLGS